MIKQTSPKEVSPILKKYFQNYLPNNDPFEKTAVYIDKEIIGVISYSIIYNRGEINYIITLPNHKRKTIATQLMTYAINEMQKQKCLNISLEVESTNTPAINLYAKFGFDIVTIRPKYYNGNDAYLMVKKLEVIK